METYEEGYIASFQTKWARAGVWALAGLAGAMTVVSFGMSAYWMLSNMLCLGGPATFPLLRDCGHPSIGGWMAFLSFWTTMAITGAAASLSAFIYDEWRQSPAGRGMEKLQ